MTKEQVENIFDAQQEADGQGDPRTRSSIQFPYNDLDEAATVAKAVHENAGVSCTVDQLAAYMKQSMTSGAFRLRMSTAAIFGLTVNERKQVTLTDLGRRIADPAQEAAARAEAFLQVPLYARIFENYKGYTLPGAAALEKFMRDVGVSSKVTDRARQAFMRSAKQAGFFAHGEDRLVRPAIQPGPGTKPVENDGAKVEPEKLNGGGGGSGSGLSLDPLLIEVLKKIPPVEKGWPAANRVRWFRTFAMNVSQLYDGDGEPVELKIDLEAAAA